MVMPNNHPGENEKVELIVLNGLEGAEIGVASSHEGYSAMIYSTHGIIRILMERDGMDWEGAIEYFYFNILATYNSSGNPMFLDDLGGQDDSDGPDDPDNDPTPVKPINRVEYQAN